MQYDILGRMISRTDLAGTDNADTTPAAGGHLNLKHHYHPTLGHLTAVEDINTNVEYWRLMQTNVRGDITQARLGNGTYTNKYYDPATGRLVAINDINSFNTVSQFNYEFDAVGNLLSRSNLKNNRIETFTYDTLYRLTASSLYQGLNNAHSQSDLLHAITLTYDVLGNILSKSDVGAYGYGNISGRNCLNNHAGPHAVTRITGHKNTAYCYDANGNMVSGDGRDILYSSFNKPTRIQQLKDGAVNQVTIDYGPERSRIKRVDYQNGELTTTLYLGNLEIVDVNGVREWKFSIGDYAQKIFKAQDQSTRVNYFHRDHLGSLIAITDEVGTLLEEFSFDAWGKRRYLDWQGQITLQNFKPSIGWETHRGFTNHEHLDSVGLIHMNGRVYDPAIGRFLSADPHIQAPHDLQNFNRYSYVNNNPLSYTDPSGYFFKKLWETTKSYFKSQFNFVKKYWRPLLAIAITVALPGSAFLVGMVGNSAVLHGAIAGFLAGAVTTGSLKGAAIGAFTGAALGGIGDHFGNSVSWAKDPAVAAKKTLAHG